MFKDPELVKPRCSLCQGRILRRTLKDGRALKLVEDGALGPTVTYFCHKCNAELERRSQEVLQGHFVTHFDAMTQIDMSTKA